MVVTSGVDHVAIRVSDMERSIASYRDLLGWELAQLHAPEVATHDGTRRPLDVGGLFTLSLNEDIGACYAELTAGVATELVQAEGTSPNE